MAVSPAKEKILKRIRQALSNPVPLPFPESEGTHTVYKSPEEEDLTILFAEEFTKLQGRFAFCTGTDDLYLQLKTLLTERNWEKVFCAEPILQAILKSIGYTVFEDLANCDVSITGCEFLTARTGSFVLSAAGESGRTASVYAPVHICIAYTDMVVYDTKDALAGLTNKYGSSFPSFVTFAGGPSRTADIEKTLVTGVHGPKEVFCFLTQRSK
jgi:L-lactate dehydrogenase complex protein LldG